ncbi:MAG: helix-turn-helix domain-containing protein [Pirellulaceae bacterium]|nr:helix-turn-helix domain-containing protein [Pirellulaceae bacterium]
MKYLGVPKVAEELGIDSGKVLAWIHSGELIAVDVAERRGGRARWRISQVELDAFLQRRQSRPPVPAARPRRKLPAVEEFV